MRDLNVFNALPRLGARLAARLAAVSAIAGALVAGSALAALAGGLFTPVTYVNDDAITNFELNQRVLLLETLRTPGDLRKEALKRLVNERLQRQAAEQGGVSVNADDIKAGVDEFAKRLDMTGDEFLAMLAEKGVAADSFRDFVKAGLAWRRLVRAKLQPKVSVSEADIDRAIEMQGREGSARVQISEIFLPINTPRNEEISRELAPQIAALTTLEDFADAARRFSAGSTREQGGRVDRWIPISELPSLIRPIVLTMRPGEVTEPVEIPNALAIFQLRSLQELKAPPLRNPVIDYAAYYIDGGRSQAALDRAADLRARVDTCDDLYGVARGQPAEVLDRSALPVSEIPADVALELARLDPGESSTALTRADGKTLVFLMLCSRTAKGTDEIDRDKVRQDLASAQLSALAEALLGELRANADIRTP